MPEWPPIDFLNARAEFATSHRYNQRPRNGARANAPSLTQKGEGREKGRELRWREGKKKVNGFESEKLCPFVHPRSSLDDHLLQSECPFGVAKSAVVQRLHKDVLHSLTQRDLSKAAQ